MTKPVEYRDTYTMTVDTPYSNEFPADKGSYSGSGMLCEGRVVFLQEGKRDTTVSATVSAFVEGIGIVLLPSSSMRRCFSQEGRDQLTANS